MGPKSRDVLRHVWSWRMPDTAGGYTLQGISRSADATGFFIPELGWSLDAGAKVADAFPRQIFITHTHSDHACRIIHLKSRRVCPGLYAPEEGCGFLVDYIRALQSLTDCRAFDPEIEEPSYQLGPVKPGDRLIIPHGKERFEVDVVRCDHTIPCVGYAFYLARKKLKAEYVGLPGRELGAMRKEGVELETWERTPQFAFLGDTSHKVYEDHPELLEMPLVIAECTFLEHQERAAKTRHTSWIDLEEVVASNPQTFFVLIHQSLRIEPADLAKAIEDKGHENVLVWGSW